MTQPDGPPKKHLPRDSAGSIELQGGTGGITAMCPCAEFLEVYKEHVTFRVRTPESIDPGRTNPNAHFVAAITDSVGSSSPAVARVLLQGRDILEAAPLAVAVDKPAVVQALHSCKEAVVVCEKAAARVAGRVDAIVAEVQATGIKRDSRGRALNPFPQIPDLDSDATTFLIHAKRAIYDVCRLPPMFLPVPAKDNNFDDLAKTLDRAVGADAHITGFVRANAPTARYLIELRNCQEHPGAKRTVVDNFSLMPNGTISLPMWYLAGETPRPVAAEMREAAAFLVEMAEAVLILLVMHTIDKRFPFVIQAYEDTEVNPKMPIKYRLGADLSRLKTGGGP
jgi:hypothetical protein